MSSRVRLSLLAASATAVVALVLIALLANQGGRSGAATPGRAAGTDNTSGFAGAALPGGVRAPDFTLTDESGRRVSLSDFRGQVAMLAFMTTRCAPACVLVGQQIRGALDELPHPPAVLIVSADAGSDTPARVDAFLAQVSLTGRAHFLSGAPGALQRIWRAYGVRPVSSGRGTFERALEVRLIDRSGYERAVFGLEQLTPEGLVHDIRKLS